MTKLKVEKNNNQLSKLKLVVAIFKNPVEITTKKAWQLIKESFKLTLSLNICIQINIQIFVNKGNASFNDEKFNNFVEKSEGKQALI